MISLTAVNVNGVALDCGVFIATVFFSSVNFVMNFTRGNLTRRLRSAPVPNQTCFAHSGNCLIEVVSKTFTDIVLDYDKVR